jgi:hypothetical protein
MVDDGILILLLKGASVLWSFSSRKKNYNGNDNALHERELQAMHETAKSCLEHRLARTCEARRSTHEKPK